MFKARDGARTGPYACICKIRANKTERFTFNPRQQRPEPNDQEAAADSPQARIQNFTDSCSSTVRGMLAKP